MANSIYANSNSSEDGNALPKSSTTAGIAPAGSNFVVGQVRFNDSFRSHLVMEFGETVPEDRIENWPMVYVLSNDAEAYVGQTTSVTRRMTQHGANPEKKAFTTASIIYNDEMNASVALDYESRLIDLMQGDEVFRLTNKNGGQAPTNYFSRATYAEMFNKLWEDLRDIELVRHSIDEIEESAAFKFSPFKVLNSDQEVAAQNILAAIARCLKNKDDNACKAIVVEGMPGTGKTVLAISLLKTLKDLAADNESDHADFHGINVRLLEPVTGLRKTIQKALKTTVNRTSKDVIGANDLAKAEFGHQKGKRGFDIILVDEAHKLGLRKNMPPLQYRYYDAVTDELGLPHGVSQLDWIIDQARVAVFFYDSLQSIGPKCISEPLMRDRLNGAMDHPIELKSQMRVKGGDGYLEYIRNLLFDTPLEPKTFDGYTIQLHRDFAEFERLFEDTLAHHSLTRMIAGYAWKWKTKNDHSPSAFDFEIDGVRKRWNRTFKDWVGLGVNDPQVAREVGCIHSIQGYDLTHAFVIIGNDLCRSPITGELFVEKTSYHDPNGKRGASDSDLDRYIRNIYYVLLTRGIESTHVYVCDGHLRELFAKYMSISGGQ